MQFRFIRFNRGVPFLLALSLVLASGCIFSPDQKPPKVKPPVEYLAPTSPQNVLQNLVMAYSARDSIATFAVYDPAYEGTSTDPSAPIPIVQFTRAQEVSHVKRLHDDPNIVSVSIDLGQPATWVFLPPNPSDPTWEIIDTNFQSIEIRDITTFTYQSSNRQIEWAFKPTTVGSTTTWTVIRWTEIAN